MYSKSMGDNKFLLLQKLSLLPFHPLEYQYQFSHRLNHTGKRLSLRIGQQCSARNSFLIVDCKVGTVLQTERFSSFVQYQLMRLQRNLQKVLLIFVLMIIQASTANYTLDETMDTYQALFQAIFGGFCYKEDYIYGNNTEYIASLEETGHLNASLSPLLDNPSNVSQITFQTIETRKSWFDFPNRKESSYRTISGMISLPNALEIKGVVLYFYPAHLDKSSIPSARKSKFYRLIAALYASRGFPVVFVDYIGMGTDSAHVHPFLFYPQQQVKAGIYILNEAVQVLNKRYGTRTEQNSWPLMTAGYSEGANYAVWFSTCSLKESKILYPSCTSNIELDRTYKLLAVGGMNGAYDLKGLFSEYLFSQIGINQEDNRFKMSDQATFTIAKPVMAAYSILGLSQYSKNPFNFSSAFIPEYHSLQCTGVQQSNCNIGEQHQNISYWFSLPTVSNVLLTKSLGYAAFSKKNNGQYYTSFWDSSSSHKNNVLAFVNENVLKKGDFYQTLEDASTIGYGNTSPHKIYIFSFKRNSIVSPQHSINFAKFNASGNVFSYTFENQNYTICVGWDGPQVDHLDGELIANIFTVHFFATKVTK